MSSQLPWWVWTVPLWPTILHMGFVLAAGWLQRRSSGNYPTLRDFSAAVISLSALSRSQGPDPRPPVENSRPAASPEQQADPSESPSTTSALPTSLTETGVHQSHRAHPE